MVRQDCTPICSLTPTTASWVRLKGTWPSKPSRNDTQQVLSGQLKPRIGGVSASFSHFRNVESSRHVRLAPERGANGRPDHREAKHRNTRSSPVMPPVCLLPLKTPVTAAIIIRDGSVDICDHLRICVYLCKFMYCVQGQLSTSPSGLVGPSGLVLHNRIQSMAAQPSKWRA